VFSDGVVSNNPQITTPSACGQVLVGEPYKDERATYAWNYSNCDKDFVLLLNAENGSWSEKTVSQIKYKRNGKYYSDVGICQVSKFYHPHIVSHPNWNDWRHQIQVCYDLYKKGTRFYGWENRKQRGKNIKFIKND
jgi:hypothetical protein